MAVKVAMASKVARTSQTVSMPLLSI
jgi:hypothetical protein